ncbi:type II toxin-antitoxin system PemK/MazF family toxin [Candidatus Parcubacteria bacterium]|nr:type II toxin-antitoxin system PemK/MazF family toxin [Candidatus Parcubacteria bacterium]
MENNEFIEKYNDWNIKKQNINFSDNEDIYFKEMDIWWCSIGLNIGSESYGKGRDFRRPILIIRKLSDDLCIALPLTSKNKIGTWFVDVLLNDENRTVMLYQIRTLNRKRFQRKMGEVGIKDFNKVKEKLEKLLEFPENHHPAQAEIERVDGTSTLKGNSIISNS